MFLVSLIAALSLRGALAQTPSEPAANSHVSAVNQLSAGTTLPKCLDSSTDTENLKAWIKANKSSSHKYDAYRKLLESESDTDILARLIYSETLAANCPAHARPASQVIGRVIWNRINVRGGNVRSVVFERDQFASSLNSYAESRQSEFLCPKDKKLWELAMAAAGNERPDEKLVAAAKENAGEQNGLPTLPANKALNYFLPKHSEKWPKAPWKLTPDLSQTQKETDGCVEVYLNPSWR